MPSIFDLIFYLVLKFFIKQEFQVQNFQFVQSEWKINIFRIVVMKIFFEFSFGITVKSRYSGPRYSGFLRYSGQFAAYREIHYIEIWLYLAFLWLELKCYKSALDSPLLVSIPMRIIILKMIYSLSLYWTIFRRCIEHTFWIVMFDRLSKTG